MIIDTNVKEVVLNGRTPLKELLLVANLLGDGEEYTIVPRATGFNYQYIPTVAGYEFTPITEF